MTSSLFEVSPDILIDARLAVAFDYLRNPASWPKWHPTSHHIDCPGHPFGLGAIFHEPTRSGFAELNRIVTASDRPHLSWAEEEARICFIDIKATIEQRARRAS
jgi:hypothetical protein